MNPKQSADYQSVLRAIGQSIEKLGVESVDLKNSRNHEFVVSGIYERNRGHAHARAEGENILSTSHHKRSQKQRQTENRPGAFSLYGSPIYSK
jgi:hypothetical protein